MKRMILSVGAAMAAAMAGAAVETVSPKGGETVELLPSSQRRVMALATQDERIAALEAMDKAGEKGVWRRTHSLRLRWRTTAGEAGPWKVELWRDGGDGARETHWVDDGVEKLSDENGVSTYEWRVPRANLELGRAYCWKVTGGIKCDVWEHGSTVGGVCPTCGKNQAAGASDTARFVNAANPPRWIAVEGRVGNMRDLGGWRTTDGRRVRQGMIYRGQALNDNSVNGERRGRNRLMVEDVDYLKGTLGVKTELDLRSPREIADLAASPLGDVHPAFLDALRRHFRRLGQVGHGGELPRVLRRAQLSRLFPLHRGRGPDGRARLRPQRRPRRVAPRPGGGMGIDLLSPAPRNEKPERMERQAPFRRGVCEVWRGRRHVAAAHRALPARLRRDGSGDRRLQVHHAGVSGHPVACGAKNFFQIFEPSRGGRVLSL